MGEEQGREPGQAGEQRDVRRLSEAEYDRILHRRKPLSGSEFAGAGMQFAMAIVLFAFLGIWLDRRLGSSPWFVILCVFAGAALGFWTMVRRLRRLTHGGSGPARK